MKFHNGIFIFSFTKKITFDIIDQYDERNFTRPTHFSLIYSRLIHANIDDRYFG